MDTVGKASKRLQISPTSIRNYTNLFEAHFSDAAVPGKGNPRLYDDNDLQLLVTIARLKSQGLNDTAIDEELSAGGELDEVANELPPEPNAIMVMQLSASLASREGELKATAAERDKLQGQVSNLTERLIDSEKAAAAANAQLEILKEMTEEKKEVEPVKLSWWKRTFG